MPTRRASAAVAVGALAAIAMLTGCEKPDPTVTVFSGRTSEQAEAVCWARDSSRVQLEDCQAPSRAGRTLEVVPGQTVGISVDAPIADTGWIPAIGDQRLTPHTLNDSYYRLVLNESDFQNGPLELRIFALAGRGAANTTDQTRGLWLFELRRAD